MGGNALSVPSSRLNKVEFDFVVFHVVNLLDSAIPLNRRCVVKSYASKKDFGDLDIVIGGDFDPVALAAALGATEIVRNGDVTSIGIQLDQDVFQVDLIKVPEDVFDFANGYFAFNDLGNLIGRIAHRAGFKFGHMGLHYVMRDSENDSRIIASLTVTKDFDSALKFLGFDPARYARGFDTLEDIFRFTTDNEFSNPDIYLLENVNAVSRVRDAKRKTYTAFLLWLKENSEFLGRFDWSDKEKIRAVFLETALTRFPDFKSAYVNAQKASVVSRVIKSKFNGSIVSSLTGFVGSDLGKFIHAFKASFGTADDFAEWVYNTEPSLIRAAILAEFNL